MRLSASRKEITINFNSTHCFLLFILVFSTNKGLTNSAITLNVPTCTLLTTETWYAITELALAIVWGIHHNHNYLFGCLFQVVTDHNALWSLIKFNNPTNRLVHWIMKLQEFSFQVVYKTGKLQVDAEILSRNPQPLQDNQPTGNDAFIFSFFLQVDIVKACDEDLNLCALNNELCDNPLASSISDLWCCMICAKYNQHGDPQDCWQSTNLMADILSECHDGQWYHLRFRKSWLGSNRPFIGQVCRLVYEYIKASFLLTEVTTVSYLQWVSFNLLPQESLVRWV